VYVIVKHSNLSLSLALLYTMYVRVCFRAPSSLPCYTYTIYIYMYIYYIYRRMEKRKSDARAVRVKRLRRSGKKKDSRYVCTLRLLEGGRNAEHRTLKRFESSISGGAVRRRIVDMFALFNYSKAAEALSVHAHAGLHM